MDGTTRFGQNNFERLYCIWAALACLNIMKTRKLVNEVALTPQSPDLLHKSIFTLKSSATPQDGGRVKSESLKHVT